MIKKLQHKFILIAMLSLLGVMLIIFAAMNGVNIYRNINNVDSVMEMIYSNGGDFVKMPHDGAYNDDRPLKMQNDRINNPEMKFITRFSTAQLDKDKQIISVSVDNIAALSEQDVRDYINKIVSSGKSKGWLSNYRYRLFENDDGFFVVFLDATSNKDSMLSLLLITLSVGFGAYALTSFLIVLLSSKAVKPIAESYEKQKQFITDASHELKTPLTVISANSEIISMNYGENEWCQSIDKQTGKMRDLVNQMVTLSRLDEQNEKIIREKFSLSDAVLDTVTAFKNVASRNEKTLETEIVPNIEVTGDESASRQMISILLDNAVKYCDEHGKITVRLEKGKKTVLTVCNSFADAKNLEYGKLFDRFYRADKARTTSGSYGLGLSIAKSLSVKTGASVKAACSGNGIVCFTVTY